MNSYFNVQRLAHLMIILFLTVYILIVGKSLFVPVAFSIFFAYLLLPISRFYEKKLFRIPAVLLAFLTVLVPLVVLVALFGFQFVEVFQDLPALGEQLQAGLDSGLGWMHDKISVIPQSSAEWTRQNAKDISWAPFSFLQAGITSSSAFLVNTGLTFIYTFLFLLYRKSFLNFLLIQFEPGKREQSSKVIRKIQQVIQKYLQGMGMVILILFVLNSTALWLIGIQYSVFWGGLAALLAVIPYVGTFMGGFLPFLYAMGTTDTWWQPIAVVALFVVIQGLEGNIISPNVIGSSMKINPFVSILSLILGGAIWGVPGLILAFPMIGIIRIVFMEIDWLAPVGVLLGSDIYNNEQVFLEKYDEDKFRIKTFLKGRQNKTNKE
ncbi:MAG: AI-2E family transporter [Saprospiraceae bacterium]|nr:AI-2E family transporter [Saprospiraceae bacterium]